MIFAFLCLTLLSNRVTDVEKKPMVMRGEEGGINWEIGIGTYTQYHI